MKIRTAETQRRTSLAILLFGAVALLRGLDASAADLPPHGPLRILVVSDGVNPHGLSPAELTEPGDLSARYSTRRAG